MLPMEKEKVGPDWRSTLSGYGFASFTCPCHTPACLPQTFLHSMLGSFPSSTLCPPLVLLVSVRLSGGTKGLYETICRRINERRYKLDWQGTSGRLGAGSGVSSFFSYLVGYCHAFPILPCGGPSSGYRKKEGFVLFALSPAMLGMPSIEVRVVCVTHLTFDC